MNTKELIAEVVSLPLEERAFIVDSLLQSLNTPESEIDKKWSTVAKRRLRELRSGSVKALPGEEVFDGSPTGSCTLRKKKRSLSLR